MRLFIQDDTDCKIVSSRRDLHQNDFRASEADLAGRMRRSAKSNLVPGVAGTLAERVAIEFTRFRIRQAIGR